MSTYEIKNDLRPDFIAIIPARYESTRFPGKPLAMLGGKPMIQHVWERTKAVFEEVAVATDDQRIADAVEAFGGRAVMTSSSHRSGTDRICEAYEKLGSTAEVVVNVQGDEPFIADSQLRGIAACFDDRKAQIATLVRPFTANAGLEALKNPNTPKVVVSSDDYALYFSRSVIPYLRGVDESEWLTHHRFYAHIGLYAYRANVLKQVAAMPQGLLEKAESLEQLRWLEAGLKIKVGYTDCRTIGIDTPQDLEAAEAYLASLQDNNL